jgi:dimeric dUTPase (all-alpha-NTP-PPase superfamily)
MVPENLSNEIQLLSNFDCWVGHTNFNITEEIKNTMNRIDGIEVLKICSRYRFFIGVGKCFNFKEVREEIEKQFISKGNIIEKN